MPEIGATLREARMRARIDISEIEAETKIRAKYLRALENEEWDLLPGPTYVRSFLRTYADALDLDSKLLLEEYKLRYERPSDHDLMPIGPPRRASTRPPRRRMPRGVLIALVILALVSALGALGALTDDEPEGGGANTVESAPTTTAAPQPASTTGSTAKKPRRAATASRLVRLQVVPTGPGPVFVCLERADGTRPISGVNVQPDTAQPSFRSKRFRLTLGNGNVRLRIDQRVREVPDVEDGIGYEITRSGVRRLSAQARPSCTR